MEKIYHTICLSGKEVNSPEKILNFGYCGNFGVHVIKVVKDNSWENLTITCIFKKDGESVCIEQLLQNEQIDVPKYTTSKYGYGSITFTGIDKDGKNVTCSIKYMVKESDISGSLVGDIEKNRWEQFIEIVKDYSDQAIKAQQEANDIINFVKEIDIISGGDQMYP